MSYRSLILADSPDLYWPLDSTYGATDQSGNARNGTGAGSISIGGFASSPISGETTCTDFDGSDDLVAAASYAAVAGTGVRTMAGWAYRDASADIDTLWGTDQNQGPVLRLAASTDVIFRPTANSSTNQLTWSSAWPGNTTWVHWAIILSRTANTADLYVNGALVSSQALGAYTTTAGVFRIGSSSTATANPFDGKMAHVAVWERALTASEIASHYQAGIGNGLPAGKTFQHQAGRVQ